MKEKNTKLQEMTSTIPDLKKELLALKDELINCQNDLTTTIAGGDDAEEDLEEANAEIYKLQTQIAELKAQIKYINDTLDNENANWEKH